MKFPPKPKRGWAGTGLHHRLINDPDWVVEPKRDGDRCLVFFTEHGPELWSRHGTKTRYGWLDDLKDELAWWDLPVGTILDCELCHEPKPNQDLHVFDIPSAEGPLHSRYSVLEELFGEISDEAEYIHLVPRLNKATAYEDALAAGDEGIVWKDNNSPYEWQNNTTSCKVPYWIKMKPHQRYRG